jgi:branched-chain amino acid transport system substrate-binding protein
MANHGIKTVGFIGFSDAYGEGWFQEFSKAAGLKRLQVVANERYARSDTSVTGQVLRLTAAKPDAILIAGSGTPAALPQKALKERGYAGKIYQTHGVANADFLRVGGKDLDGTSLPAGPVLVADQLPASHPVKKSALAYVQAYEGAYGKGTVSTFGAHAWDAGLLMTAAIPVALKKAQPGTPAFRAALRDGGPDPVGKRLGFVLQEMLREANTTGSKANDSAMLADVVGIKEELERIREQVENLE